MAVAVVASLLQVSGDHLERVVDCAEGRPQVGFEVPAEAHQLVDGPVGVLRALQNIAVLEVLHHLLVGHSVVGLQGEREDLP